ncbi:hypothetical protein CCHR01_13004 [Colletotrichum chrysophilum]|uniref:Uncharacterized protein n=1 Tax=Colletotrichum chrysophilum TaxID=1836956 RepID=A0AAD9AA80_9PEZI|nr:hypothetical protein CCHR01_13004 [Colletotrichum chrysophilum]
MAPLQRYYPRTYLDWCWLDNQTQQIMGISGLLQDISRNMQTASAFAPLQEGDKPRPKPQPDPPVPVPDNPDDRQRV